MSNLDNPLFSVLVANYNNAKYLEEAIESVKEQTYTNWEIILVDDGSTDSSKTILRKYLNKNRIKIFYNRKNKGRGYTKHKCIELAQGEICGFLDSDDLLENNALEKMIELHKAHKDCSLIYSTLNYYTSDKGKIGIPSNIGHIPKDIDFCLSNDIIICHFATFKRNMYFLNKRINPKINSSVDVDMYLKLEEVGNILFFDKPLYLYRMNNDNSVFRNIKLKEREKDSAKVMLSAITRRISKNSKLYTKNKIKYIQAFKFWLYMVNDKYLKIKNLHYLYVFFNANEYSMNSLYEFVKIRLKAFKRKTNYTENFDYRKIELR